ncbi:MAG: lytic transglycosylase domain-containing protein [Alphaproteobacteria bacterium]|nr:lytic transglycosylase domain-containing protein [Alphaproteobacteria bacterium]
MRFYHRIMTPMRKLFSHLPGQARATVSVIAACIMLHVTGGAWILSRYDQMPDIPVSLLGRAQQEHVTLDPYAPAARPMQLTYKERETYKKIFSAVRGAEWNKADALIGQLTNPVLLGHVEAERLLHPSSDATSESFSNWEASYGGLPQAVMFRQSGRGVIRHASVSKLDMNFKTETQATNGTPAAKRVREQIHGLVTAGKMDQALSMLVKARDNRVLSGTELDAARWVLARGYFNAGDDKQALLLSRDAALHSGRQLPGIVWMAGLAAWRLGEYDTAARYFSQLARNAVITGPDRSAAAFWAWRAYGKLNKTEQAEGYLRLASASPRSFYGLLARQALEQSEDVTVEIPLLTNADLSSLLRQANLRRALALHEIGETYLATMEIRQAYHDADASRRPLILSFGRMLELPTTELAALSLSRDEAESDLTVYPLSRWKPRGGYQVEPALMAAFIRQESGFNPLAGSPAGAQGLMQIMPDTARFLTTRHASLSHGRGSLTDPEYNLSLGQAYLGHLMEESKAGTNLFFLAAAYNAGPGNLARWIEQTPHHDDPLLFIESIPYPETRNYIEQVMANYWVYQQMSGQRLTTASDIIEGRWPSYRGFAGRGVQLANAESATH